MDFELREEEQAVADLSRQIIGDQATNERLKELEAGGVQRDDALWKSLAEANLLGVAIDEAHGGMGFGFVELCVLLEELGRQVAPVPALETLVLGALPLDAFGSEAQRTRWLPKVASGETILTAALVDAESSDVAAPATRARRDGDAWVLDGVKRVVPFAGRADAVLVWWTLECDDAAESAAAASGGAEGAAAGGGDGPAAAATCGTAPGSAFQDHWHSALHPLGARLERKGRRPRW